MPRPKKTDNENTLLQEENWTGKAKIHSKIESNFSQSDVFVSSIC